MKKLTDKQATVLKALDHDTMQGATPTDVGQACGKPYHQASGYASSAIRSLVNKELVQELGGGYYRITKKGRSTVKKLEANQ